MFIYDWCTRLLVERQVFLLLLHVETITPEHWVGRRSRANRRWTHHCSLMCKVRCDVITQYNTTTRNSDGVRPPWCSVVDGARLVIKRSRVRLPAGALPGSLGQLSLPSLRVGKSSASLLAEVKARLVYLCRVAGVIPYGKWRPVALRWETY